VTANQKHASSERHYTRQELTYKKSTKDYAPFHTKNRKQYHAYITAVYVRGLRRKTMLPINRLCDLAHQNAVCKGFWEKEIPFNQQIAHIKHELSEALLEYTHGHKYKEIYYEDGKPCGVPIELADCIILIMSTCGRYGIDLEKAIEIKMEYNKTRPYLHK
jgi:NTP pyrophosphatase (non-canonical NTP hydrolase)